MIEEEADVLHHYTNYNHNQHNQNCERTLSKRPNTKNNTENTNTNTNTTGSNITTTNSNTSSSYDIEEEVERVVVRDTINHNHHNNHTIYNNNKGTIHHIIEQELQEVQTHILFLFPELYNSFFGGVGGGVGVGGVATTTSTATTTAITPFASERTLLDNNNNNNDDDNNHNKNSYNSPIRMTTPRRPPPTTTTIPTTPMMPQNCGAVLWKRRDIFIHQWRPRWFIIHPELCRMTYYLLLSDTVVSSTSTPIVPTTTIPPPPPPTTSSTLSQLRNRTTSYDSQQQQSMMTTTTTTASNNTIDYDVVPRGTIDLYQCTVSINEQLSSKQLNHIDNSIPPLMTTTTTMMTINHHDNDNMIHDSSYNNHNNNNHYYAFTIVTHDSIRIHLATRTEELRQQWIHQIRTISTTTTTTAIHSNSSSSSPQQQINSSNRNTYTTPATVLPQQRQQQQQTQQHHQRQRQQQPLLQLPPPATVPNNFQRRRSSRSSSMVHPPEQPQLDNEMIESTMTIQPRRLQLLADNADDENNVNTNSSGTNNDTNNNHDHINTTIHGGDSVLRQQQQQCPSRPIHETFTHNNVPVSLQQQIDDTLAYYLPMCGPTSNTTTNNNKNEWKKVSMPSSSSSFSSKVLHHTVHQRMDRRGSNHHTNAMIQQTFGIIPYAPIHIFRLIIDINQRQKYETNTAQNERMEYINPYTFFDYYAYKAVWPTKAREFTVVTHWKVIELTDNNNGERSSERSIVILSFSCDEASRMRPNVSSQFVRANLFVSLYILRPIPAAGSSSGTDTNHVHCQFTRLLSFDLAGNIPQQLSNVIGQQQANLPVIISNYMHDHPSEFVPIHHGQDGKLLSNELLVSSVINPLMQNKVTDGKSLVVESSSNEIIVAAIGSDNSNTAAQSHPRIAPSFYVQLITLLTPVLCHRVLTYHHIFGSGLIFCLLVFLTIRTVVIWHIGETVQHKQQANPVIIGHVTCRLRIDLKGILRYISNKHEERDEMKSNHAGISVIHIVASALGHALKKEPLTLTRTVSIPWLLIKQDVDVSNEPIDVSVSENGGGIVTLTSTDRRTIQQIADCHKRNGNNTTDSIGHCLILAMSNYDEGDMTTDAAPIHSDVAVVAVLGGVHLERNGTSDTQQVKPKPFLNISLTITGTHQSADLVTCRRFADEVRKLLLYPEICETLTNGTPMKLESQTG